MRLGSGLILRTANESHLLEDIAADIWICCLENHSLTSHQQKRLVFEEYYVMHEHDVMHDMAQAVSLGECLRSAGIGLISIAKTVRHLSIKLEYIQFI